MFNKKHLARIAELEEQLAEYKAQEDGIIEGNKLLHETVTALKEQIHTLELEVHNKGREIEALIQTYEASISDHTKTYTEAKSRLEIANSYLKGSAESASSLLDTHTKTHRLITSQHEWHQAGSAYAHGETLVLWECLACKSDPSANTRLLLPEGVTPHV